MSAAANPSAPSSPDGARAVPYVCAFCGEEDLRPVEQGRWHCRCCLRVFSVAFHGVEPVSFSAVPPARTPGRTP